MRKGQLRTRLRALRLLAQRSQPDPLRWLNDAPRAPPIAASERISDASSTTFTDLTLEEQPTASDTPRLSTLSHDRTCLICLDDIPEGTSTLRLPCRHATWHADCVTTWLRAAPRCPMCNAQIAAKRACYRGTYHNTELAWTLHDRRMPEFVQPVLRRDSGAGEEVLGVLDIALASRDLAWRLDERRLSLASRPRRSSRLLRPPRPPLLLRRTQTNRRFIRSLTPTPRW